MKLAYKCFRLEPDVFLYNKTN